MRHSAVVSYIRRYLSSQREVSRWVFIGTTADVVQWRIDGRHLFSPHLSCDELGFVWNGSRPFTGPYCGLTRSKLWPENGAHVWPCRVIGKDDWWFRRALNVYPSQWEASLPLLPHPVDTLLVPEEPQQDAIHLIAFHRAADRSWEIACHWSCCVIVNSSACLYGRTTSFGPYWTLKIYIC